MNYELQHVQIRHTLRLPIYPVLFSKMLEPFVEAVPGSFVKELYQNSYIIKNIQLETIAYVALKYNFLTVAIIPKTV